MVDVHDPMRRLLADGRRRDQDFRMAGDGVHIDEAGHWLLAREILLHRGVPAREVAEATGADALRHAHPHGLDVLKLVRQKQRTLRDAWLTATGHERPGMKRGLPLEEAEREAARLDAEIGKLLMPAP